MKLDVLNQNIANIIVDYYNNQFTDAKSQIDFNSQFLAKGTAAQIALLQQCLDQLTKAKNNRALHLQYIFSIYQDISDKITHATELTDEHWQALETTLINFATTCYQLAVVQKEHKVEFNNTSLLLSSLAKERGIGYWWGGLSELGGFINALLNNINAPLKVLTQESLYCALKASVEQFKKETMALSINAEALFADDFEMLEKPESPKAPTTTMVRGSHALASEAEANANFHKLALTTAKDTAVTKAEKAATSADDEVVPKPAKSMPTEPLIKSMQQNRWLHQPHAADVFSQFYPASNASAILPERLRASLWVNPQLLAMTPGTEQEKKEPPVKGPEPQNMF